MGALVLTQSLFRARKWELTNVETVKIRKNEYLKVEKRDTSYIRVSPSIFSTRYWLFNNERIIITN